MRRTRKSKRGRNRGLEPRRYGTVKPIDTGESDWAWSDTKQKSNASDFAAWVKPKWMMESIRCGARDRATGSATRAKKRTSASNDYRRRKEKRWTESAKIEMRRERIGGPMRRGYEELHKTLDVECWRKSKWRWWWVNWALGNALDWTLGSDPMWRAASQSNCVKRGSEGSLASRALRLKIATPNVDPRATTIDIYNIGEAAISSNFYLGLSYNTQVLKFLCSPFSKCPPGTII